MSKITKAYETKLETAQANSIKPILDAKLEATSPERVTDYVAFALDNLDAQIKRMKDAKAELDTLIAMNEQQKQMIKNSTAEWLEESGVDGLSGDRTSSMKITQPKAKEVLVVDNEEELINQGFLKMQLDKTAVKEAILNGAKIEGAHIEVEHQQPTLTVYKRRNAKSKED